VTASRGVLRIGDQVLADGVLHQVVAIEGTAVSLIAGGGRPWVTAAAHLMAFPDFKVVGAAEPAGLPPLALLDTVPAAAASRARMLESHILEVLTGLPANAVAGQQPRPEYDPDLRMLTEREAAKAAELTAAGEPVSLRTLARFRQQYQAQGLWGLVDHRLTRPSQLFGRVDPRVIAALRVAVSEQTGTSTGTRERVWKRAAEVLAEQHPGEQVLLPSRATFYRVMQAMDRGEHTFGSAPRRRSNASRPAAPFTMTLAQRPGEIVQIDSTPLDVMLVLDDGVLGRPELTVILDVATRTIAAAVLRPEGTKAVDAAVLLARMLVPEQMRPGWDEALAMARSALPFHRLTGIDQRLAGAAARPVIVPETIVVDHGKVFVSDTFVSACRMLGVSVQPARAYTPTDKAICERTFASVNTLFCQHVAGYTGSDVSRRGSDVADAACWTLPQLQEMLDEWVIAGWQTRPHEGLRHPLLPGRELSPNQAYAVQVARAGYLPVPLSGTDYIELLPSTWRAVNAYGILINHRTYDCAELGPLRRQKSASSAMQGRWEVHYDPYDLSRIWVRGTDGWITAPWTQAPVVNVPFADFTWRYARKLVAEAHDDDTDQAAVARMLAELLHRAGRAPGGRDGAQDRKRDRIIARTAAAVRDLPLPAGDDGQDTSDDGAGNGDDPAEAAVVEAFGVFDPLAEDTTPW